MKELNGAIEGAIDLTVSTRMNGMFRGPVTVRRDVLLELHGMANETIYLEQNSSVIVRGTVIKDIINQGGDLKIFGMVRGTIYNLSGELFIDEKAHVKNVVKELND